MKFTTRELVILVVWMLLSAVPVAFIGWRLDLMLSGVRP